MRGMRNPKCKKKRNSLRSLSLLLQLVILDFADHELISCDSGDEITLSDGGKGEEKKIQLTQNNTSNR